jgi:plasmid stabilization system protein ParE
MKVVYSEPALRDLVEIGEYQRQHWPAVRDRFAMRLGAIERLLLDQPRARSDVPERPGVRTVSLGSFPYRVFYKVTADTVEILHIRHTSRRPLN